MQTDEGLIQSCPITLPEMWSVEEEEGIMTRKLCHVWGVIAAFVLLLLASSGPVLAAQTGKIAGRITDRASGEPLTGAAVVVRGTRIGTSTDADGRYFLINLPPGAYDLEASLIGYRSSTIEGIRVNIDRTTPINFELEAAAIEVGGVTVLAPREVIQMDVSGSKTILEPTEITAVPVKSMQEALALQPGVGVTGGIRGGGLDQTQMIVDGRLAIDERMHRPIMTVSTSALQEVEVLTGGFNAEYGNARSGVINVVTRDAIGMPIWLNMDAQYYPAHKKFYEPDGYAAFGENSYEWQTWGNENVNTLAIGTKLDPTDASKTIPDTLFRSWTAVAASASNPLGLSPAQLRDKWRHQHPAWDYANKPDYVIDGAVGAPIHPMIGLVISGRREYTAYATPQYKPAYIENQLNVKVNLRPISAVRLDLGATYGTVSGLGYSDNRGMTNAVYRDFGPSINFLDAYNKYAQYSKGDANHTRMAFNARFVYTLDPRSFINAELDYTTFKYRVGPSSTAVKKKAGEEGVIVFQGTAGNDTVNSLPIGFLGEAFPDGNSGYELAGGASDTDSSDWTSMRVAASYTNQINTRNQLKAGFEGVLTSINQWGGHVGPKDVVQQKFSASPVRFGLYAQDKIEYEGMIANVGLRLDYYASGAEIYEPNDPFSDIFDENMWGNRTVEFDPTISIKDRYGPNGTVAKDSLQVQKASAKVNLSPRLGISHPITSTTKIFFNYGHFYTVPQNYNVYGFFWNQPGSIEYNGNADLDPPRTISYELGVDQELFGKYLLRASIFYKDATKEISLFGRTSSGPQKYTRWVPYNKAYSDIRGFEFAFTKRVGKFITGFVNGGVQTQTTTILGNNEVFYQKDFAGSKPIPELRPIPHRAQPYGKLNVDLHTPMEFSAFGMPALATGGWSLSWLTSYSRGGDAIYDPVTSTGVPSGTALAGAYVKSPNVVYQDWWMSDMRLTKAFAFGKYNVGVYMDVFNVLGRKVWTGSMRMEDLQAYMRSLHFDIQDPIIEDTPGHDKIGDTPSYAKLPSRDQWTLWSYPRTFAFGLRVSF